jgi:glycosyltransferase involved in cell wall biosynthesis
MKTLSSHKGAQPSIAVIVPNRNDSRYLTRCLRSVFDQPVAPDELIVVDDQSTDDSVAVIRGLTEGRAGVRFIQNPVNLGVYGATHEGLRHSRSEYALFLASNDFVLPGIFERAKRCIAQTPGVGLWSAMAWHVDEMDRPLRLHPSPVVALRDAHLPPHRCIELALLLGNWFTGTSLIYRRAALDEAGKFDALYMGLSDLFTALIVASRYGAAYSPEPFCAIRKHADSYLERTLNAPERLEYILSRLAEFGVRTAPGLFSPKFVDRTIRRFRFASVRSSEARTMQEGASHSPGWAGPALRFVDRTLPRAWRLPRIVFAFVVLRPFDLVPTLWYRFLGWVLVRARSRWVPLH